GCLSIWLDVPFETCWSRIEASEEERPLGKTREQALLRYEQRRPVYELAKLHIESREETFEDLVSRIITSFS
ncbi:MAG TPA: shikimate kinase, partial [Pyrinomonadaceae bacterium]|nr:shikimate kinase [Pyrinomonadaceae bacterium]